MTQDLDQELDAAFADFRTAFTPYVAPPGPTDVRTVVRRRRRTTVTAVGVCTALLVAAPALGWAVYGPDRQPPPTDPAATTAAPGPTAAPTPSAAPPTSPSASPSATTAPDGRVTLEQLLAGPIDLPAFPEINKARCEVGDRRLVPHPDGTDRPHVDDLRYGDVDGDGAVETVATIACSVYEFFERQVVALDRNAAGRIVVLGRVTGTHLALNDPRDFSDIGAVRVTADGTVRVEVTEHRLCCGPASTGGRHQWRAFRYDGDRFGQTGGPTTFPGRTPTAEEATPSKPDSTPSFTLTATPLVFGAEPDEHGGRWGTSTVTVVNTSSATITFPMISVPYDKLSEPGHSRWWDHCVDVVPYFNDAGKPAGVRCAIKSLRAGQRVSIALPFMSAKSTGTGTTTISVSATTAANGNVLIGNPATATFRVSFAP